jgi:hypothetical protein
MKNLIKSIALLLLITLAGCGSVAYIQGDKPIIVKTVQQIGESRYLVEAYARDNYGRVQWVYFETKTKYTAGDTLAGLGER